jgi:hypothetical protein
MAEPLAALGLAANVVQFIHFVSGLISSTAEIASSVQGSTKRDLELQTVYRTLTRLNSVLILQPTSSVRDGARQLLSSHLDPSREARVQSHVQSLVDLAAQCNSLCEELLGTVRGFQSASNTGSRFKSFLAALKSAWGSNKVKQLEERIERYRGLIAVNILPLFR